MTVQSLCCKGETAEPDFTVRFEKGMDKIGIVWGPQTDETGRNVAAIAAIRFSQVLVLLSHCMRTTCGRACKAELQRRH